LPRQFLDLPTGRTDYRPFVSVKFTICRPGKGRMLTKFLLF
jgi:hypothetical protein